MTDWKQATRSALVRLGRHLPRGASSRAVILCYHSVHPRLSFRSATPDLFAKHLRWLTEQCDVVPLTNLLEMPRPTPSSARPRVAITFDDGYRDNYEFARPLLQQHHCPATFFLTTGFLERTPGVRVRVDAAPEQLEPLTWAQARELAQAGFEIGAHTCTHPNLANLARPNLERELGQAKRILEERLESPVTGLAYPYGKHRHFNATAIQVAQEVGYRYAVAVCYRGLTANDSRWALPRFFVAGDSLAQLQGKVSGAWDLIGQVQERTPIWLSRLVSPRHYLF